jgi:hypothetical protein
LCCNGINLGAGIGIHRNDRTILFARVATLEPSALECVFGITEREGVHVGHFNLLGGLRAKRHLQGYDGAFVNFGPRIDGLTYDDALIEGIAVGSGLVASETKILKRIPRALVRLPHHFGNFDLIAGHSNCE